MYAPNRVNVVSYSHIHIIIISFMMCNIIYYNMITSSVVYKNVSGRFVGHPPNFNVVSDVFAYYYYYFCQRISWSQRNYEGAKNKQQKQKTLNPKWDFNSA